MTLPRTEAFMYGVHEREKVNKMSAINKNNSQSVVLGAYDSHIEVRFDLIVELRCARGVQFVIASVFLVLEPFTHVLNSKQGHTIYILLINKNNQTRYLKL